MKEYNYICKCNLKHGVFVDGNFLGKKIPIKILDKYSGDIVFPILPPGDYEYNLFSPCIDKKIPQEVCGKVSKSIIKDKTTLHPTINSVYFAIDCKEKVGKIQQSRSQIIREIEVYTSKFRLIGQIST